MKLICLYAPTHSGLEVHKIYEGMPSYFTIEGVDYQDGWTLDGGQGVFLGYYSIPHFISLAEWRE